MEPLEACLEKWELLDVDMYSYCLLITESFKEVSPLLPDPCHFQDYHWSVLYPAQPGSAGCSSKMCMDGGNDEDAGNVCYVRSTMQSYHSRGIRIGAPIQFSRSTIVDRNNIPDPLGPFGCECAQHRPTPRPSLSRICRKALFSDL